MEDFISNNELTGLNRFAYRKAIDLGMCAKVQRQWKSDKSIDDLLKMFKSNQEFCIKHDFPTIEFLTDNVNVTTLEKNNVYVNTEHDVCPAQYNDTYVIIGDSNFNLSLPIYTACTLNLRHKSKVKLDVGDHSYITINLYDSSSIEFDHTKYSKIKVYDYRNLC